MHQKAGPCRALWRTESNHAEQGQAPGRKERGLQTVFWLVWDSAQQCKEMGLGHKDGLSWGARSTCIEAQHSKWHRIIWASWHTRIISVLGNWQHRGHKFKVILRCETTLNLVKAIGDLVLTSHPTLLQTTTTKRNKPPKKLLQPGA